MNKVLNTVTLVAGALAMTAISVPAHAQFGFRPATDGNEMRLDRIVPS